MRLWIDDPMPLAGLRPGIDPLLSAQIVDGVDIRRWSADFTAAEPAQVVVETFACALPDAYVAAMAAQARMPVWINLEYLSAEDWVAGCHGLASPHPRLPLVKYFFFPGFVPGTGGLLRERDADFGSSTGADALNVSLFCYRNPALPALLAAWRDGTAAVVCQVADGLPLRQAEQWAGRSIPVGTRWQQGALTLLAVPFVPQDEYDRRLGGCALNFVRGEDSFVRAQWAGQPLVWQIYPQADDAHRDKLTAFLDRYRVGLDASIGAATATFWRAWNGDGDVATAWPAFLAALPALARHGRSWAERIALPGDLAANLARFCRERL
jgi:uncharacterized repeat protein (TIGR03837 family)